MFERPNGRRDRTPRESSSLGLSSNEFLGMADGGMKLVDCIRDSDVRGANLAIEALYRSGGLTEWEHYRSDDVRYPKSPAQCYFRVRICRMTGTLGVRTLTHHYGGPRGCLRQAPGDDGELYAWML